MTLFQSPSLNHSLSIHVHPQIHNFGRENHFLTFPSATWRTAALLTRFVQSQLFILAFMIAYNTHTPTNSNPEKPRPGR